MGGFSWFRLGRRKIGVEHVDGAFPIATRLLLPNFQILALVRRWLAARVCLAEFIRAGHVGQIAGLRPLHFRGLPTATETSDAKHSLPHRARALLALNRRHVRR